MEFNVSNSFQYGLSKGSNVLILILMHKWGEGHLIHPLYYRGGHLIPLVSAKEIVSNTKR